MAIPAVLLLSLLGTALADGATANPAPPAEPPPTEAPAPDAAPSWPSPDPSWPPADPPPPAPAPVLTATRPATGQAPPSDDPPPFVPPTKVERFGGQIVLADVGVLALAYAVGQGGVALIGFPLAAPAVHIAHGDGMGAAQSLLLHALLPIAGAYIGFQLEAKGGCGDLCLGGLVLGGVTGMASATIIDAAVLARVERPYRPYARAPLATPTLAIARGGLMLGVAGRM